MEEGKEKVLSRVYQHPIFKASCAQSSLEARRQRINDHSLKHFEIVREYAERIYALLKERGAHFDIECSEEERALIIALAALMHDLGMGLGRKHHEIYSVLMGREILEEALEGEGERKYRIMIEILAIIANHRTSASPSTLEGEIVRLADALDIAHGRAKIPYLSPDDIHKISAESILSVEVSPGHKRAVRIVIEMKNAAGMYLVTNFLKKKIGEKIKKNMEIMVKVEEGKEVYDFSP